MRISDWSSDVCSSDLLTAAIGALRTRFLDSADAPVKVSAMPMMRAVPLSELLGPVTLDPLTVVQDSGFVDRLAEQANIPAPVMAELRKLYDSSEESRVGQECVSTC